MAEGDVPRARPVDLREQRTRVALPFHERVEVPDRMTVVQQADGRDALAVRGPDPDPQMAAVAVAARRGLHADLRTAEVSAGALHAVAVLDVVTHRRVGGLVRAVRALQAGD